MIILPDPAKTFDYENYFYQTCDPQRIGKLIAHYELFKIVSELDGDIVECGVFKGASLIRFAMYRKLFNSVRKKIIGFDSFAEFPETNFEPDIALRKNFIDSSGGESISINQLVQILNQKDCGNDIELIPGDITKTVPEYVSANPGLKISMLNLDVDVYEPSVAVLENLYSKIQSGGILVLDDYGVFPGETKAVDEFFKDSKVELKRFSYTPTPCYLIKS